MELHDIMALVHAGYNKEEIEQITALVPETPEPAPAPAPAPDPEPAPEPAPAPATEPAEQEEPTMADLMKSIAKLTSAIQANAIANSNIPGGPENGPDAVNAIAEIIRPTLTTR